MIVRTIFGPTNDNGEWRMKYNNELYTLYKESDTVTYINLLAPNVNYSGRTARLTSKIAFYIFIQQI